MGFLGGEASTDIEAPIDEVWAVVEDVASAPAWQEGLDSMEPLEHDPEGRVLVADSTTDAKVRQVTTRVRFEDDPPHRMAWRQEKGDLRSLEGAWELEDLGGRTRAIYRLKGGPGRGILVGGRPAELKARVEGG